MSIKDWPEGEGPRDKAYRHGLANLSDAELLAIILGRGVQGLSAVDLAKQMLSHYKNLAELMHAKPTQLQTFDGIGKVKALEIATIKELCCRMLVQKIINRPVFDHVSAVKEYLQQELGYLDKEVFGLLLLDNQHQLIQFSVLFHGTVNSAAVYPREIVKIVLEKGAAAVILVHNHPSGVAQPSEADKQITEKVILALSSIDVRVLDHFIVAKYEVSSFAEKGIIF